MKRILLLSFMLSLTVAFSAIAQRTVSGKVTSAEDGSVVPGVNVILKGTTTGTTTDLDGNYRLSVPEEGGTLVYSFIGFQTQELAVGARSVLDVVMQSDIQQLTEVVVTGYQSQLKREVTGAVSSVKGDVIQDLPMQSFDRAIQGRVAGVQIGASSGQPGGAMNIRIRGIGSINAGNAPLIIIDGVQVASLGTTGQASSNPLNSINPNDIESIDVLKDASAAAIYGAQAANGVIVVTTKSGANKGGKSQINFSMQEGVVKPHNLYDVLDAQQFVTIKAEQESNDGLDPARPGGAYEVFGNPEDPTSYSEYDWLDEIFQDARFKTYDLSLSGGDSKTSFFFGGSYNHQEGQIIMSDFERITGRLNLTHRPTDKLTVTAKMSVAHIRQFGTIADGNFVNGPWVATFEAMPVSPAVDSLGEYNPYPTNGLSHLFGYNILQGLNEEVRLGRQLQTVSSASAAYQITPWLSASAFVGLDYSMNRDDNERPRTIPVFAAAGGSVAITNRRTVNVNSNYNLNFNKTFAEVHKVKGLVGYEYKFEEREGANLTANGFANAFFRLPGNGLPQAVGGFWNEYKRLGIYGKVDYDFDDRYLISGTLRRDGHSRFGSKTKYGTFYAFSAGWRLSSESFMEGVSVIEDLKLRGSYGVLGNAEIRTAAGIPGDFLTQTTFGGSTGQYLGASTVTITQLGNDQLTWEEEAAIDLGFDFSLFENRLFGTVDFWKTDNRKLLFNVPFFQNAGVTNNQITQNVGTLENRGIDIDLGAILVDRGGFRWETAFNVGFLKNEVKELSGDSDTLYNAAGTIPILIVGQPVNFFYLLDYAGVNPANGRAMIRRADGSLAYQGTFADAGVRGSAIPSSFGGWSNTFSYKGVTLDVFFQYQLGNEAFNGDLYNLLSGRSVGNQRVDIMDRWQQPGDITSVPRVTRTGIIEGVDQYYGFVGTNRFLSDGSYIRLKTITVSYDFPTNWLSAAKIRSARVFFQGLNLMTWSKFDGIDPEVISNNSLNGVSTFGAYPLGKQFSFGVNLGL